MLQLTSLKTRESKSSKSSGSVTTVAVTHHNNIGRRKQFTLDVDANILIFDLKLKFESQTGLTPARQYIFCDGKIIQDNALLSDCSTKNNIALHLIQDMISFRAV